MAITFNAATAGATFGDLFSDSATGTTWYRLWTGNAAGTEGNFVDTSAFNDYGNGWIQVADVDDLQVDFAQANDTDLWVQTYDGSYGSWTNGAVTFNDITGAATTGPDAPGLEGVPVATTVVGPTPLDEIFNLENVASDTWVRIWVGDASGTSGSYLDTVYGQGWVEASKYGSEMFVPAAAGQSQELWVTTWDADTGYAGWEHWTVTSSNGDDPVGQTLTLGIDTLVGSSADDTFVAPISQNTMGGTANTLADGDSIDGGLGTDTLWAKVVPQFTGYDNIADPEGILSPDTESVEIVKFQAQQGMHGNTGVDDDQDLAGVDAGGMNFGPTTAQLWSTESRADLVIEDVRHNSYQMTIGMQETQGSSLGFPASDFKVDFAKDYIEGEAAGQSFIDLILEDELTADGDLSNVTVQSLRFNYDPDQDGTFELVELSSADIAAANNHTDLAAAFAAELAAQGYTNIAGNVVYEGNNRIRITDYTALDNINFQALTGAWTTTMDATADIRADTTTVGVTEDILTSVNVILDDVGRGSTWTTDGDEDGLIATTAGGFLDIGSVTTGGVQHFDVQVGRASNVASLTSTNRSMSDGMPTNERLESVAITDWNASDEDAYGSGLQIGNLNTNLALLDEGFEWAGLDNVRVVNAAAYTGDLTIFAQLDNAANFAAERQYLDRAIAAAQINQDQADSLLEALWNNRVEFEYTMGTGNDEFVLDIDDPADSLLMDHGMGTNDAITELDVSGGDGDDVLALDFLHEADYGAGVTYLNVDPASTSVTRVDGGGGHDTLELSHSPGVFGDARGTGRAFYATATANDWNDVEQEAPGVENIENLLVSDRLDASAENVYVDFDALDRDQGNDATSTLGTNKIGGANNYYEVTNNEITELDNTVVFHRADYDQNNPGVDDDYATDLILTGGPGIVGGLADDFNVGDVTVTLEDYDGTIYDDITQRVFVNNLGRSGQILAVNSLTINDDTNTLGDNDLSQVLLYSQGSSRSATNVINSFVSTDIDRLYIVGDNLDGSQQFDADDNETSDDMDLSDEDLTITIADVLFGNNVDYVDASSFTADLTINAMDNVAMTIMGGSGDDFIRGGKVGDELTGNGGTDTFDYNFTTESYATNNDSLATVDWITDLSLDADGDMIDISDVVTPAASQVNVRATTGATDLTRATLLADLNTAYGAVGTAGDGVIDARIITDSTLVGDNLDDTDEVSFLVVDVDDDNAITGFDLVINISGYTGTLTADNFVLVDTKAPAVTNLDLGSLTFDCDEPGTAYLVDSGLAAGTPGWFGANDAYLKDVNGNYYNNAWLGAVNTTDPTDPDDVNAFGIMAEDIAFAGYLAVQDAAGNIGLGTDGASVPIYIGTQNAESMNDVLAGSFNNFFFGFGGADTVNAGAGNDHVTFGDDGSTLNGGLGTDTLFLQDDAQAGPGANAVDLTVGGQFYTLDGTTNALVTGFENVDVSAEGTEAFTLTADNTVANELVGGGGNDTLNAGTGGGDTLWGGGGADTLNGATGIDTMYGGSGNDTIFGGGAADVIEGGAGADFIQGDAGIDDLTGGDGADIFSMSIPAGTWWDDIQDFNQGGANEDAIWLDVSTAGAWISAAFSGASTFWNISGINTVAGTFQLASMMTAPVGPGSGTTTASAGTGAARFIASGGNFTDIFSDMVGLTSTLGYTGWAHFFVFTTSSQILGAWRAFISAGSITTLVPETGIATLANVTGVGVGANQIQAGDLLLF